ncbi:hypothetical protein HUS23_12265 [Ectothiorhodospiraceae bacterium 2226]|nr:hypothetical protein HUS23_12265 [Ectothiorhodospiraceae bacterium 2226]
MKDSIVIVGLGEMGGVFARGLLRTGHPVMPVTREIDLGAAARETPGPKLVLVAVAEDDLHPVLESMPDAWRTRLALLQNELLPGDWERHAVPDPTVVAVWFEKKKGQDVKVLLPSPVYGPHADLLCNALTRIDIPARVVDDADEMLYELVRKNVYILTVNIAGLVVGGTVDALWREHNALAREVADEVIDIQEGLTGRTLDRARLIAGMVEAIEGDPEHKCMGRSAPARLTRALMHADAAGLEVPRLRAIAAEHP